MAPKLCAVRLGKGLPRVVTLPWKQITHYEGDSWLSDGHVLSICPNISTFVTETVEDDQTAPLRHGLKYLHCRGANKTLNRLSLPALESLRFPFNAMTISAVLRLLRPTPSILTQLHVDQFRWDLASHIQELFSTIPALVSLTIVGDATHTLVGKTDRIFYSIEHHRLLPALRHLRIIELQVTESFVSMAESRSHASSRTPQLDSLSLAELRVNASAGEHYLERLEQLQVNGVNVSIQFALQADQRICDRKAQPSPGRSRKRVSQVAKNDSDRWWGCSVQ